MAAASCALKKQLLPFRAKLLAIPPKFRAKTARSPDTQTACPFPCNGGKSAEPTTLRHSARQLKGDHAAAAAGAFHPRSLALALFCGFFPVIAENMCVYIITAFQECQASFSTKVNKYNFLHELHSCIIVGIFDPFMNAARLRIRPAKIPRTAVRGQILN